MLRAIALACAFLAAAVAARACEMFENKRLQASRHVHVFQAAAGVRAVLRARRGGGGVEVTPMDAVPVWPALLRDPVDRPGSRKGGAAP